LQSIVVGEMIDVGANKNIVLERGNKEALAKGRTN